MILAKEEEQTSQTSYDAEREDMGQASSQNQSLAKIQDVVDSFVPFLSQ